MGGLCMRPLNELLFEEYWDIGYRFYKDGDSVVDGSKKSFNLLRADKRFWYADPFLFEKDGRTYLFVEMFDNKTEVGIIGCSEFIDGRFTVPEPVLKESFHLSYPYVFEQNGKVFMMPETHEDGCIQLYEAEDFPHKWKKSRVLVKDVNAVDTVIENGMLIASVVCPSSDMSIDLSIFDMKSGRITDYSPVCTSSLDKRGAGQCFSHNGRRLRPAQSCENGNYGGGIIFNEITQCDENGYAEKEYSTVTPEEIVSDESTPVCGIHTYARTGTIEIVDIKFRRTNLKRLFWILKRKAGV